MAAKFACLADDNMDDVDEQDEGVVVVVVVAVVDVVEDVHFDTSAMFSSRYFEFKICELHFSKI